MLISVGQNKADKNYCVKIITSIGLLWSMEDKYLLLGADERYLFFANGRWLLPSAFFLCSVSFWLTQVYDFPIVFITISLSSITIFV
jgi:hypothetical protein